MKITIEGSDKKIYTSIVTVEIPDEADVYETIQAMCELLLPYGFAYDSIRQGVAQLNEVYSSMDEDEPKDNPTEE